VILLAGCAGPASRWRDDASSRFNSALSAGSSQFAPEETENIRQTMALADRYFATQLYVEAEHLYQLSCQKSQLLYRSLILNKVRQGASVVVSDEKNGQPEVIDLATEPVSMSALLAPIENNSEHPNKSGTQTTTILTPTGPPSGLSVVHSPLYAEKYPKKVLSKRIDPGRTTIYLTFDDGPSRLTLPIAAYLNSQGIAATFFALGSNIKGHEKVISETIALGHYVGNHTLSHNLSKLNGSLRGGANEIEKTATMLAKLGGDGKMVRIPYGATTKKLSRTVASEGGQIFDWDINSLDSSKRGAKDHVFIEQAVVRQLQKSGKRHIIMLFHDGPGHQATLTAIRTLVPRFKQEGYRFGLLHRSDHVAQLKQEGM
jgi:peptidoglycan/xylan/chitin deacetylase (PgdA/CDA1 family)